MSNQSLKKFQDLLRELFQFDCADLDFGIYRIMNYKRGAIESFIEDKLPQSIIEELQRGGLADRAHAEEELKGVRERVLEDLGRTAIDADGNLDKRFRETPLGKQYLVLKSRASRGLSGEALEENIFNHLYSFFSRYYEDGDYISKRRYSRQQRYVIPYNGEEVYLHWANSDQYYIKTAEHFHNYSYKASNGVAVHFRLEAADIEQNNVLGEKRFFLSRIKEISWDDKNLEVIIPFEYRPLTEQESISYGTRKQQDAIISETLKQVPENLKKIPPDMLAALIGERRKDSDGRTVTFLEHHMRHYTRRNTSDFFIHRNLRGFLSRELDFYLKNEVLNLDEVEAAGEGDAEGWFQTMRVIRSVAGRIISFLDQVESFQKMLWEKRKFVTETHYCVRVGIIDKSFYPEVVACEAQWDEWRNLFCIDEEKLNLFNLDKNLTSKRIDYLKNHPALALDTKHFSQEFTDRLLATFDDLDGMTDGVLLHSENFQAVSLLLEKYKEQATCVHIDPPYNTRTNGFLYKNDYQHSSWLTMMENRISSGISLLKKNGSFVCHIDENEHERLHLLFERMGIPDAGTIVWDKRNPVSGGGGIASQHEYVIWRTKNDDAINLQSTNIKSILDKAKYLIEEHGGVSEKTRKEFSVWVRKNDELSGGEKAYSKIDEAGRVYRSVSLSAPELRKNPKFFEPLLHPVTKKPCSVPPNGFSRTPQTLQAMVAQGEILFGSDETKQPEQKRFLTEKSKKQFSSVLSSVKKAKPDKCHCPKCGRELPSVLPNAKKGKSDLDALGLGIFPYCHSVSFYMQLLGAATDGIGDLVVDYFSGSGTTGHAVINLNREDAGQRKFILVEMGEHFTAVVVPRIKKVMFSPEWKKGKPKRMATSEEIERSPRIVKYQHIESYEDSLNNIEFDDAARQHAFEFKDDYLIQYMLRWETKQSAALLNVEKLCRPFSYKLFAHSEGGTREAVADIPETFNYLLGLRVRSRRVYSDGGRRYLVYGGRSRGGSAVTVIWRETEGWEKADYARDREFVAELEIALEADEVFVNGDSRIPNAQALEPLFKSRMFKGADA